MTVSPFSRMLLNGQKANKNGGTHLSKVIRIGVLADTHVHDLKEISPTLLDNLKTMDLVIHLGDFVSMDLVDYFKSFNNFYGVAGNHDPHTIKAILRRSDVIEVNGKRLGLLHGYWFPFFCDHRSRARFKKEHVDAILYGHTHVIRNEVEDNSCGLIPAVRQLCGRRRG